MADLLHNTKALQFPAPGKQLRKAREILDFFVPVAQQLSRAVAQQFGMATVTPELRTLALRR